MSRPVLDSISVKDSSWFSKINDNFGKLLGAPYPLFQLTGMVSAFDQDARLFNDCLGIYEGALCLSNGVSWNPLPNTLLSYIADLDTSTATLSDIKETYNNMLADMRSKFWIV